MTSTTPLFKALLVAIFISVLAKWYLNEQWKRKYRLPPGPRGIPFFGNMFQMPPVHQGPWAKEMAEKYGEMFTINIASNTWVFLNSSRVITALLEKRSAIYSSRPPFPYASTLMSGDCRMVIQPYGPQWRAIRKIMHSVLNITNAPTFAPFQDLESRQLLVELEKKPEEWYLATQRFANSTIMSVVFGKRILSRMTPNVSALFATSAEFIAALQPGANLVDTFYILDKLPLWMQWWRDRGFEAHQRVLAVYQTEVDDLRVTARVRIASRPISCLRLRRRTSDARSRFLPWILAAAASDTRWVRRAQAELDAYLPLSLSSSSLARLPDFSDRPSLPYLSAVVKEALRWRPFAEIGVPHMLVQDDEFEGWKFPKGTIFTWNAWGIAMSEREYVEPERFWPERWLGEEREGKGKEGEKEGWRKDLEDPLKGHWSFGAGRRVCTGYHVGDTNIWIAAARLLYCFDFLENPDKKIDTMDLNAAEHRWAPFEVKIVPRSEGHRELIRRVEGELPE
ncbi:cytochrome P450 [Dendryphion nanum]|uniref:Cytochrome P450 n=1 Tax=Dendryphion nanum TaxID=256645 RepID=A0A9P9DZD5_9PLEO|nr:cytochrome P450 [Dendryphion nanum]